MALIVTYMINIQWGKTMQPLQKKGIKLPLVFSFLAMLVPYLLSMVRTVILQQAVSANEGRAVLFLLASLVGFFSMVIAFIL